MKYSTTIFSIVWLLVSTNLQGQATSAQISSSILETNISSNGFIEDAIIDRMKYYESSNKNGPKFDVGFSTSLILAGTTDDGIVQANAQLYNTGDTGGSNFTGTAINQNTGLLFSSEDMVERIWTIKKQEIDFVRNKWSQGILTLEDIPKDLLEWPAKGNMRVAEGQITFDLAPYFDSDGDNLYDPLNGDYPIVDQNFESFVPSIFTFNCINERFSVNPVDIAGVEMQVLTYMLDCKDNLLSASVNYDITIVNQGDNSFVDFKFGIFNDTDLGCHENDLLGSSIASNSFFSYNSDGVDTEFCPGGYETSSQDKSVIQAHIFHSHDINSFISFDRFGAPAVQFPNTITEFVNCLDGKWRDGTPMTYGGNGFDPASTDIVKHIYSDFPNLPNSWSQDNLTDGASISSIDLGQFEIGEKKKMEFSKVIFVEDFVNEYDAFDDYLDNIEYFNNQLTRAKNGEEDCFNIDYICDEDCVWPGDFDQSGRVDGKDMVLVDFAIENEGNLVSSERASWATDWIGWNSQDWEEAIFNYNLKHADVNGDGVLDNGEFPGIVENFGLTNEAYTPQNNLVTLEDDDGFGITMNKELYAGDDFGLIQTLGTFCVDLYDGLDGTEFEVDRLTYELQLDTSKIFYSRFPLQEQLNFNGSVFFESDFDIEDPVILNNSPRVQLTHLDAIQESVGAPSTLYCQTIVSNSNATTKNIDGRDTTYIAIANVFAIDKDGNELELGIRELQPIILFDVEVEQTSSSEELLNSKLKVFPNPAKSSIQLSCDVCESTDGIKIYNVFGQEVYSSQWGSLNGSIALNKFNSGEYFIQVQGKKSFTTSRFTVVE